LNILVKVPLISCTGKGTICNMGAEIGATTSTFDMMILWGVTCVLPIDRMADAADKVGILNR
jgi:hypothetical protein